jgi:SAM-dependent methyltransferase
VSDDAEDYSLMFELGTVPNWWTVALRHPMVRSRPGVMLKTVGYGHVIQHIEQYRPKALLEFGHSHTTLVFKFCRDGCELWGLDDTTGVPYIAAEAMQRFHAENTHVKFVTGLLGKGQTVLPTAHFDMVCSVSVLEHVPLAELPAVFAEIHRILKPGGLVVNSYDTYHGQGIEEWLFKAHAENGFEWLKPGSRPDFPWDAHDVAFEDPRVVMEKYLEYLPQEQRKWLGNFATILSAARKI